MLKKVLRLGEYIYFCKDGGGCSVDARIACEYGCWSWMRKIMEPFVLNSHTIRRIIIQKVVSLIVIGTIRECFPEDMDHPTFSFREKQVQEIQDLIGALQVILSWTALQTDANHYTYMKPDVGRLGDLKKWIEWEADVSDCGESSSQGIGNFRVAVLKGDDSVFDADFKGVIDDIFAMGSIAAQNFPFEEVNGFAATGNPLYIKQARSHLERWM